MDQFYLPPQSVISFSGGRTSAYMLRRILGAFGGTLPDDRVVVFCNTGKERPETLDFVNECSLQWNVPVRWLEYRWEPGRHYFAEVNYTTASRNGEPFEAVIRSRGFLPNPTMRFCTGELKIKTTNRFVRQKLGWKAYFNAIGLRADEPQRVARILRRKKIDTEQTLFGEETKVDRGAIHPPGESPICPLALAGVTVDDVAQFWRNAPFDLGLPIDEFGRTKGGNCDLCLAAETEVVTSDGIRRIGDLVGQLPELLVPKYTNGVPSEVGKFLKAPVRSFGVQRLWRIDLAGHGRSSKVVYATGDHRWFLTRRKQNRPIPTTAVATKDLKTGDKLRNLFRCPIGEGRGGLSRIGAMRGFVFGDGTVRSGNRPGVIQIHEGNKEAFYSLFDACCGPSHEGVSTTGGRLWTFYGLPNFWKTDFPDLKESRHYLMGWLSGWFAADGCVADNGSCILSSATRSHLEFARSLCAILGIQHSPIRSQVRLVKPPGGCERMHEMYGMKINRHHLAADFFWLEHHKQRANKTAEKETRRYGWTVKSVSPTDRLEEVFCATVEGIGAFGLADGLMTGNCFLKGAATIAELIRENPSAADWWIHAETMIRHRQQPGTARFRADRPNYHELKMIATDQQPTPGWLWADKGGIACGDVADCNCTD